MQKLALAAVAAICLSGAAFAGQATKPAAMTDAEMDRVTAGDLIVTNHGGQTLSPNDHAAGGFRGRGANAAQICYTC
jgi:cytochrome oxidase Cu insertion factor (SCO1/SenC/PrrC family)